MVCIDFPASFMTLSWSGCKSALADFMSLILAITMILSHLRASCTRWWLSDTIVSNELRAMNHPIYLLSLIPRSALFPNILGHKRCTGQEAANNKYNHTRLAYASSRCRTGSYNLCSDREDANCENVRPLLMICHTENICTWRNALQHTYRGRMHIQACNGKTSK